MHQLSAASSLDLAIDPNQVVLDHDLGLKAILDQFGQLEKLTQADRQIIDDDWNWFYIHYVVF